MRRLWIILFIVLASSLCFAQRNYELSCPSGSFDMEGPTYNPLTNMFRSWLCVDSFGNVTSPAFGTGGQTLGPAQFVLARTCPSGSTNCFQSPLNTQLVTDCSWSNASTSVSCSSNHFVPSDVGKRVYGFATCKTNQLVMTNSLGATATTISSVTSPTAITISLATTGAQTSPSCLIFGNPDDTATTALDAAAVASPYCPIAIIASSGAMWATNHFNTQNIACQLKPDFSGQTNYVYGYTVQGLGAGSTTVYLTPDFPFNSAPCTSAGLGCFGVSGMVFRDFTLSGGGLALSGGPTFNLFGFATGLVGFAQGMFDHFSCTNIGGFDTNSNLFAPVNATTPAALVIRTEYSAFDGCAGNVTIGDGSTRYEVLSSLETAFEDMSGSTCAVCSGNKAAFVVAAGSEFTSDGGNLWAPGPPTLVTSLMFLNAGGIVRLGHRDVINSSNGTGNILVTYGTAGTGCITWAHQTSFGSTNPGQTPSNTNNSAYTTTCTNDQSFVTESSFIGGATGNAITLNATGSLFHDLGGNVFASGNPGRVTITNGMYLNGATEIYNQTSATQTGSIAATTMSTPANTTNARVFFRLTQIAAGTGCTTNTTISPSVIWTDPLAAGSTTAAVCTFTITNNGTANTPIIPPTTCSEVFAAKSATAIQFSTTFTGGTCTTTPTYQITPTLNLE